MKFPKGLSLKQKKILKEAYEETYQKRKKVSGKKKAKYAARAKFYEEAFKMFLEKENYKPITERWRKNKYASYSYIKEDVDYKVYKVNGVKFYTSTDEKLLEKFSDFESKGMLRNMTREFDQEVLFKAKEKYNITLHPDMYYVIRAKG